MKKVAKILRSGRSNSTYYFSTDLHESVRSSVTDWEDTEASVVGNRPEAEAYEVWLVGIDEEDLSWSEPETLEVGVYHEPPMAKREGAEGDYVYQPLLTGKRMQVHKNGGVVSAFDHKGNPLSGNVEIGETTANLSSAFLSIACMEEPERAIFDAVMLTEDCSLVLTDILACDDYAAHELSAVARMGLLEASTPEAEGVSCVEWSTEPMEESIARPADEGYFSEWIVVPEGAGRNNGDRAGAGPDGKCVCPECGYEADHETGQACNERECPECGAKMTRKAD